MGDHLLMKTLLLILTLTGALLANADVKWVDAQVAAIKPPRTGISNAAVNQVRDPFIFLKKPSAKGATTAKRTVKKGSTAPKKVSKRSGKLRVTAIMNDSALINGQWYKANEKVRGYRISKIERASVFLTRGKEKHQLFISTANKKIKIQTK